MHNKYILRKLCQLIDEGCFGRRDKRARIQSKEKDFCKIEDHVLFSDFHKNTTLLEERGSLNLVLGVY